MNGSRGPALRYAVAPIWDVEVRNPSANPDDTWTFSGCVAVFGRDATLYDGDFLVRSETIDPGFFDPIFRDQPLQTSEGVVHFNYGHDTIAATDGAGGRPGWLALSADGHGLRFLVKVARDDADGVQVAVKLRSGLLNTALLAFQGTADEGGHLLVASHLFDICATSQAAEQRMTSRLRSYGAWLGLADIDPHAEEAAASFEAAHLKGVA